MNEKIRNKVYEKAIARIERFMSNNATHWKQDIDFMKHLLEEKQELEQILEKQKAELIELREERQFYKRNGIERAEELTELKEFETKDRVDVSKKEYLELLDYKEKYLELKSRFDSMEYNINNKLKSFENLPSNIIHKIMFGLFDSVVLYHNPAGLKTQLHISIDIVSGDYR